MTTLGAWGVTYLVHSTLLIALAWLASRFLRSASARDTLWKVALLGGIVTATLQLAAPLDRVVPQRAPRRMTLALPAPPPASFTTVERNAVAAPPAARPSTTRLPNVLPLAWAAIAALLLGRIAMGRKRFLTSVGRRIEVLRGDDRAMLDRLASAARVARPIRLTESAGVRSPVAMLGWEIVIPAAAFSRLTEPQRETILAHELAHLVRRDPLWLTAAEVVKALLFFQPLNWLAQTQMRETAEFLCDDAAVLQTGNRKALAETLAELAASVTAPAATVVAMAEGGSSLVARVTRVLRREGRPDAPLRLPFRILIALTVIGTTAAFAPGITVTAARAADETSVTKQSSDRVNHLSDGDLSRSFDGPEGATNVTFHAHDATISMDGSVAFDGAGSFVRARQVAAHGPTRDVEVLPGRDLQPVYHYRVDGIEKAWCDDARRVIAAAFAGQGAYAGSRAHDEADTRPLREAPRGDGPHTWNATIELTGSRNGAPSYLSIHASEIRYTNAGEVTLDRGSFLHVEEKVGGVERTYKLTQRENIFHSSDPNDTIEKEVDWLRSLLRTHTTLSRAVIDELIRQ